MDEAAVVRFVSESFGGVEAVAASGDTFFMYDPDGSLPPERKFPFATLVTADRYDRASNLDRPGAYRLNIGVAKETYRSRFGPPPPQPKDFGVVETGHDFTALDQLLPHPVYAPQSWVCILNPSDAMFQSVVRPLLTEAYHEAVRKYSKYEQR